MASRLLVNGIAAAGLILLSASLARAGDASPSDAPNYGALKKTLEQKFAPPAQKQDAAPPLAEDEPNLKPEESTRSLAKPVQPAAVGQPAPAPVTSAMPAPNNQPTAAAAADDVKIANPEKPKKKRLFDWLKRKKDSSLKLKKNAVIPQRFAANTTSMTDALPVRLAGETTTPTDSTAPSNRPPAAAEGDVLAPVAQSNSYVIQLKPDATEQQIAKLLEKYKLTVTKVIGELGVITVEQANPEPTRGVEPNTPSHGGASTPEDAQRQLESMLEPQLIKELRDEPIVDAAIVNSTISTKVLPKPSGVTLKGGGKSYDWTWGPSNGQDGNWGLKNIRMPPVWTILEAHRKANPDAVTPKIGVIDLGFNRSQNIPFQSIYGSPGVTVLKPDCSTHHGMHVAGIIGARQGETPGIDGIIPNARVDAIGISSAAGSEAGNLGVEQLWEMQTLVFDEVLAKTMDYLVDNVEHPDNLRVINISLGYNFLAKKLIGNDSLDGVNGLKLHIHHQASILRKMAQRVESKYLFVVAAGNDSDGRTSPLEARWSSPFAWAGTYAGPTDRPAKNILVVEANGRDGARASFSNTGGHISAPGVDIMSTLASAGPSAFGVCSGTSQAAPHVAAVAAILFELDPSRKPADIIEILTTSARKTESFGAAPQLDALGAVLAASPKSATALSDIDADGVVGARDLRAFGEQAEQLKAASTANADFKADLNGDGAINDNECHYPRIDLDGSGDVGRPGLTPLQTGGLYFTDLTIMGQAWDNPAEFPKAVTASGLGKISTDALVAAKTNLDVGSAPLASCRGTVTGTVTPVVAEAPATEPSAEPNVPPPPPPLPGVENTPTPPPLVVADNATAPKTDMPAVTDSATVRKEVQSAVSELKRENPKLRVTINPATGLPSSISGFTPRTPTLGATDSETRSLNDASDDDVKSIVEGFFASGGITSSAAVRTFATANKDAVMTYVGKRRDPDFPDRTIATVEQRIDGIPVFGSSSKLTLDQLGGVSKFTGTASQVAIEDTEAKVSEAMAIENARGKLKELFKGSREVAPIPLPPAILTAPATPKLVVYDPAIVDKAKPGPARLAYMVSIEAFRFFVDAKTGEVFHYYRDQQSGMVRRVFDLSRSTVFPGTKVADEKTGEFSETINPDSITAFRNGGVVRDYFLMLFGRDSFDDNDGPTGPKGGGALESYVRYGSLSNAYWCPAPSFSCPKANVMVYGPGYGEATDIVGHEFTHGVIQHEKNLIYMNEPGAVNESLADIFGSLIEIYATIPYGNWVIGEKLPGYSEAAPMRSMSDPNLRDRDGNSMFNRSVRFSAANRGQPDHYSDVLTPVDPLCGKTRMQDNGCVHFNSGILNKFAYMIAEGGTHRGIPVDGIGRIKLARIAYRTMTANLNESSGLIEAADGFMLSCLELSDAGRGGIVSSDCDQVYAAQTAVGLASPGS